MQFKSSRVDLLRVLYERKEYWVSHLPCWLNISFKVSFPGGSNGKEFACNVGEMGSTPGLGRSPGGGHGNPLQCSCLENPMDRGAWQGYSPWGHKESVTTERLSTAQAWLILSLEMSFCKVFRGLNSWQWPPVAFNWESHPLTEHTVGSLAASRYPLPLCISTPSLPALRHTVSFFSFLSLWISPALSNLGTFDLGIPFTWKLSLFPLNITSLKKCPQATHLQVVPCSSF